MNIGMRVKLWAILFECVLLTVRQACGSDFVITETHGAPTAKAASSDFIVTEELPATADEILAALQGVKSAAQDLRQALLVPELPPVYDPAKLEAAAAPTPYSEVVRVLGLLPTPQIGFVDFGCGRDARWCIAAAERWDCPIFGVEIERERANAAKARVRELGLADRITIIEGDALTTAVRADVGVAYLYPDVLEQLKPQILRLKAFASYQHKPPVAAARNGDSWVYTRPTPVATSAPAATAHWNGQAYTGPICSNPNCAMCNAIRAQLAAQQPVKAEPQKQPATKEPPWHYEYRKVCYVDASGRRFCKMEPFKVADRN